MNTDRILIVARASVRLRVLAFVAAALFSIQMTVLFAQSGGQGRSSQPGELQRDPKQETQPGSGRMDEVNPSAITVGARMNETPQRGPGDSQPLVDLNKRQSRGKQTDLNPGEKPNGSHLHLQLRITEDGKAELVSATEVTGDVVLSDDPMGDLVYEVAKGDELVAVQSLSDPFEQRSFPPPGSEIAEHHFGRAKSAIIVVKVPKASLESAELDSLTLRIYEMLPGDGVEKLDPETFDRLRRENRLQMKLDIPGKTLGPQIRQKGKKLIQ